MEKGDYNPSLTLSFKLKEIFGKSLGMIFYQEPIITDLLGSKTLYEIEEISEETGINKERIIKLINLDDDELLKLFNERELHNISKALGVDFDTLFIKED